MPERFPTASLRLSDQKLAWFSVGGFPAVLRKKEDFSENLLTARVSFLYQNESKRKIVAYEFPSSISANELSSRLLS
ncbi:MAG: hypothetical protein WB696_15395, partial [Chthoniobacterales bacterium]